MKLLFKIIKLLVEILFFLFAAFLMFYVSYYFGWAMLPGGMTFGNDIPSAMNNVYYIDYWYPPISKWNHLWSGGMPNLQLYPILPFLTTFFVHHLFGFTIMKAMKLVMFFSLPLAALGVAVLGRILTKNWWVGLLAGVIMLLQPDSWLWITFGGFFAVASSVPAFVWSLVFFSLAMQKEKYWLLILASFSYGLTWLFHPMAGMLLTVVMGIMGIGFGLKIYGWRRSWKSLLRTFAIGALGIGLFAWWIFPFFSREEVGGIGIGANQMYKVTIRELLGLDLPIDIIYITSTFYAASGVFLFVLGCLAAFLRKSILRWAVVVCFLALFIMTAPYYAQPIVKVFVVFWSATNVRSGLVLRILGSVIAAYGAVSLTRPIFWAIERFVKKIKDKPWWFYTTETIGGAVGLFVLLFLLKTVITIPPFQGTNNAEERKLLYSGYGPYRNWFVQKEVEGKKMAIIFDKKGARAEPIYKETSVILKELPKIFSLTGGDLNNPSDEKMKKIVQTTGITDKDRVDSTPMGGGFIGMFNNFTQAGQVQGYMGTSLIQRMIGWQIDCTYQTDYCGPQQAGDLESWFGVSQILTEGEAEKVFPKYDPKVFKKKTVPIGNFDGGDSVLTVYSLYDDIGLASITNKPAILIIGDNPPNNDVFDIVFRSLGKVNFGYKDAWSVRGKRYIDDYSVGELKKFEGIILHGYNYHNKKKAWIILEEYVKDGGSLFVDTGWQYFAKDWGKEENGKPVETEMPGLLPVKKTLWTKIKKGKWDLSLGKHKATENLSLKDWGEPVWSGMPWGVALAKKEDLKENAEILLENEGKVITASWEHGRGKVVWTGFDFWGHLVSYKAYDEREFVRNVLDWLVGGKYEETKLDFERKNPDVVKIKFASKERENKLLFKEVASDNWKAELKSSKIIELPIYKAGPGWKMVFLPEDLKEGEVVFSFKRNKVNLIGLSVSLFSLFIVPIIFILKFFGLNKKMANKVKFSFKTKKEKIKKSWDNEDDKDY